MDDQDLKFECGFQEIYCDYRGKDGVCNREEEDINQPCPAGE